MSVEQFEYYLSFSFKVFSGANIFLSQVALTEKWAEINKDKGIGFYSMHPGWAETPGVAQSLPSFSKAYGTFHLAITFYLSLNFFFSYLFLPFIFALVFQENLEQARKVQTPLFGWLYSQKRIWYQVHFILIEQKHLST